MLVRERQIPYDNAFIWNLKKGTNEPINISKKIELQILWDLVVGWIMGLSGD